MKTQNTWLNRLILVALGLAFCVILLGAYTRLADAGLGCPDWPGCYGQFTAPSTPEEISVAESVYPTAPVDIRKARTEMTHRYFAETLGFLIICIAGLSYWQRRQLFLPLWLPSLLVSLVIFQGLLGMWTVTYRLHPLAVSGHLLGGFATLSLLWLSHLYLRAKPLNAPPTPLSRWSLFALVLLIGQIFLGGWTSANYSALICLDFPTCHGRWWPETHFSQAFNLFAIDPIQPLAHMDFNSRTTIQVMHRLGALLTFIGISALIWQLYRQARTFAPLIQQQLRKYALLLKIFLIIQVSLGISNILFVLPMPVAVAHNGVAALLLLTLIGLNFTVLKAGKMRG